ncbi:MAG: argininosuccinate lyase [Desulfomonilaceae bacterium]|nr:argininosuccinate lyase [Desulfomonilaceae bacterium]
MARKPRKESGKPSKESVGIRKGRFEKGMDPEFARFNASIAFDKRLAAQDITGSIAHVKMLGMEGILSPDEAYEIEMGLTRVLVDIENDRLAFRDDLEDIHIHVEEALKEKIGDTAGKLHTARSRNDQVALDLRLYVLDVSQEVSHELLNLMTALTDRSSETMDVLMPGYTHLQRAQPVRLSHHLMAYFQMFRRDWERFRDARARVDEMPLGSAALAGTTFPVNRETVATLLGFSKIGANSMDAVSDRDFAVEFVFDCSMVMMHLSRLSEELILWSTSEFGFCRLPDAYCSGSSIMPQKKNPDACELIRGKTGRVFGDLMSLLTTLKALPLTYNKDLQEDKEPLFDAIDTVKGCIKIMTGIIRGVEFDKERMNAACLDPSLAATDLADGLTREGVPFREAHSIIGARIRDEYAGEARTNKRGRLPSPEMMAEARCHPGGTARASVDEQIRAAREFLSVHMDSTASGKTGSKRKRKG